jgi:hypothetical protein
MHNNSEKGQAGLEFVIILPVLLLALYLITIIGNQLYQKLSAQAFTYSHCMWEVTDIDLRPGRTSAFSMVVNDTKKTWNTEGLWESYPSSAIDVKDFEIKTCVGSVTHDEWNEVGFGYLLTYNPDVLVESKLSILRSKYMNVKPQFNQPVILLWGESWEGKTW